VFERSWSLGLASAEIIAGAAAAAAAAAEEHVKGEGMGRWLNTQYRLRTASGSKLESP
jgi:hypothetical protein